MPTTGGALAFARLTPPYEATLTTRLREAGAVIIAKTVLTELANWVAGATPMPANYSALAGFGINPYDPRRDPRHGTYDGRPVLPTGGSSSGIGTAASFWAANVGTETSGSILSPSNQTMLVGIKPTRGPHQPLRGDPHHRRPGHARADGAQRSPTPPPCWACSKDVAGSARCGHDGVHAAAEPRLHAATSTPTASRARASAFRARSSTTPSARRRHAGRTRRTRRGQAQGDDRGHRRADARQGAIIVDPADLPSGRRPRIRRTTSLVWRTCAAARTAPRATTSDCSVVFNVRHEARLQRLAGVARGRRAREDAHRAARVQPRARARRER